MSRYVIGFSLVFVVGTACGTASSSDSPSMIPDAGDASETQDSSAPADSAPPDADLAPVPVMYAVTPFAGLIKFEKPYQSISAPVTVVSPDRKSRMEITFDQDGISQVSVNSDFAETPTFPLTQGALLNPSATFVERLNHGVHFVLYCQQRTISNTQCALFLKSQNQTVHHPWPQFVVRPWR